MDTNAQLDRTGENTGNIVHLEHVNVCIPDQLLATSFYMSALGLTRDPFMMTGVDVMWVNIGRHQFHLPSRGTQVLRGHTVLVLPWYDELEGRLEAAHPLLQGSAFDFTVRKDRIDVTCPWGNRIRCCPPGKRFGGMSLGMPEVVFDVPEGTAPAIALFYEQVMGARCTLSSHDRAPAAAVATGLDQTMYFRETKRDLPPFDGHHIQIYISDFAGPYEQLLAHGAITAEDGPHQYRFENIFDPDTGETVYAVEHEVRSLHHPLYARPLVNRNPAQRIMTYTRGADALQVG